MGTSYLKQSPGTDESVSGDMKPLPDGQQAIAIIPARGGSKRLPDKNLLPLAGLPVLAHTVQQAVTAKSLSEVYVSTDDPKISTIAGTHGATVVTRPKELCTDTASSESALLHVLDERLRSGGSDPDIVVFLQCTSPVRAPDDIDRAIELFLRSRADSLLSVCVNHRFLWRSVSGSAESINYEYKARPREQDMAPQYQENGSIYICRTSLLRRTENRLGGRIALYEMDYWSSFQLDDPADFKLLEWIMGDQPGD